jgi:prepilin-type N-terminal cleavage/methylation domain-containing protein
MRLRFAPRRSSGFTLLEVIVATMIVGMLALTLYRFLASHLSVIRQATELSGEREALQAVVRLVQSQLRDLPPAQEGSLLGQSNKFHGLANDEITWRCEAGAGLLTTAARGEYRVTLTIQPVTERSAETELGLRRQPVDFMKAPAEELNRGGAGSRYHWLPLVRPAAALEIRYFDPAQKQWVDAWADSGRRPSLVRLRLWKRADEPPVEAVLPVPSGRSQL